MQKVTKSIHQWVCFWANRIQWLLLQQYLPSCINSIPCCWSIFALDFARLRNCTCPYHISSWIADFLNNRWHCSKYASVPVVATVLVNTVCDTDIGPVACLVIAADLWPLLADGDITKIARDTCLIILTMNSAC